jgi:UBX domain-containing protein 1
MWAHASFLLLCRGELKADRVLVPQPGGFGSLDALKNREAGAGGDSDDDEQEQKFYVGGAGRAGGSGQNVIDPSKLMDRARQLGAVSASEHEQNSSSAFVGAGYSMSGSSEPVVKSEDPNKVRHTITLWRNGFSIDDGPLRSSDDPTSQEFLKDLNDGRVPAELAGCCSAAVRPAAACLLAARRTPPAARPALLYARLLRCADRLRARSGRSGPSPLVSIVGRTTQDYEPPAGGAAVQAFAGAGHSLGGGGSQAAASEAAGATQAPTHVVQVDEAQPATTVQFRMHDGTRHQQRFNLSDTVASLYAFAASACPGVEFDLASAYPRKVLRSISCALTQS